MVDILSRVRAATKRQQALLDAIGAAGWDVGLGGLPNSLRADHPRNSVEIDTPEYVPIDWWPGDTYVSLRSMTILFSVVEASMPGDPNRPAIIRIYSVLAGEHSSPWVHAREHSLTLTRAIEWLQEQHPADRPATHRSRREAREGA